MVPNAFPLNPNDPSSVCAKLSDRIVPCLVQGSDIIKTVLKVAKLLVLAGIPSGQPLGEVHMWLSC